MRSYEGIVIGVAAAAVLAAGNFGCAAKQPSGPEPWEVVGQQASAAAGRAEAAAGRAEAAAARTEAAANRVEAAMARAEASMTRSMRK
jgi:hypothetical protein